MILGVTASSISKGVVFDTSYQAILDHATTQGYTLPSVGVQAVQNQLVLDLKANGIWDEELVIYSPLNDGSEEFGAINWKNPGTKTLVRNGAGWSTAKGYIFSSDGYVDTNLSTSELDINNAGIAVFASDNIATNNKCLFGCGVVSIGANVSSVWTGSQIRLAHMYTNAWASMFIEYNNAISNINFNGYMHIRSKYNTSTLGTRITKDFNVHSRDRAATPLDMTSPVNLYLGAYNFNGTSQYPITANIQFYSAGTAQDDLAQIKSDLINQYVTTLNTM